MIQTYRIDQEKIAHENLGVEIDEQSIDTLTKFLRVADTDFANSSSRQSPISHYPAVSRQELTPVADSDFAILRWMSLGNCSKLKCVKLAHTRNKKWPEDGLLVRARTCARIRNRSSPVLLTPSH